MFLNLPTDILYQIFDYLNYKDLKNIKKFNKKIIESYYIKNKDNETFLTKKEKYYTNICKELRNKMGKFSKLIILTDTNSIDQPIDYIFDSTDLTDKELKLLNKFKRIREECIKHCEFDDCKHVASLTSFAPDELYIG